jgi:hypothetical protein
VADSKDKTIPAHWIKDEHLEGWCEGVSTISGKWYGATRDRKREGSEAIDGPELIAAAILTAGEKISIQIQSLIETLEALDHG